MGRVRFWRAEDGWGVIDSEATPGGCWAHFSVLLVPGYKSLDPGRRVRFAFESAEQDGYAFRAVAAWPADRSPVRDVVELSRPSAAYHSTSTLTFDDDDDDDDPDPDAGP